MHLSVRKIQKKQFKIDKRIKKLEKEKYYLENQNQTNKVNKIQSEIDELNNERNEIVKKIPSNWDEAHNAYKVLATEKKKAVTKYRRNVDSVYENIQKLKEIIKDRDQLSNLDNEISNLKELIFKESKDDGMNRIKSIEKILNEIAGAELIKEKLSKARRTLKKDDADIDRINTLLDESNEIYMYENEWRAKAEKELLPQLIKFDDSIKNTIGLRLQEKLTKDQAKYVAACRSVHTDISLNF